MCPRGSMFEACFRLFVVHIVLVCGVCTNHFLLSGSRGSFEQEVIMFLLLIRHPVLQLAKIPKLVGGVCLA